MINNNKNIFPSRVCLEKFSASFKPFPNDKFLNISKQKEFAEDSFNSMKMAERSPDW